MRPVLIGFLLAGCIGGDSGGADAGDGAIAGMQFMDGPPTTDGALSTDAAVPSDAAADGGFAVAPHTPFPALPPGNGFVLAKPQLVTITFQGYAWPTDVEGFGDFVVGSTWLATVGAAYGVSNGMHLKKARLGAAPGTLTDAQLQQLLVTNIMAGVLPVPDSNPSNNYVLYAVYLPSGTTVTNSPAGGKQCVDWSAYHYLGTYNGANFPYSVLPDCAGNAASVEYASAHELIEAATDEFDSSYQVTALPTDPWSGYNGFEVADLCAQAPMVNEGGYTLPRVWSNAGSSPPCLPIPTDEVFFDVSASPSTVQKVAAGSSMEFTLIRWSAAPIAPWTLTTAAGPKAQFNPSPSLSTNTIDNGASATLTLSVPTGTPAGQTATVTIYSGGGTFRQWPVTIQSM